MWAATLLRVLRVTYHAGPSADGFMLVFRPAWVAVEAASLTQLLQLPARAYSKPLMALVLLVPGKDVPIAVLHGLAGLHGSDRPLFLQSLKLLVGTPLFWVLDTCCYTDVLLLKSVGMPCFARSEHCPRIVPQSGRVPDDEGSCMAATHLLWTDSLQGALVQHPAPAAYVLSACAALFTNPMDGLALCVC